MNIRKIAAIAYPCFLSSFRGEHSGSIQSRNSESMYDKAFREFDANNYREALKQLDAIDARQPDLAESQNLRGVIFMRQKDLRQGGGGACIRRVDLDPKFWNARFNLAEIPFLQKNWAEARNRFRGLLSSNSAELQGEATQLIQYKILLTYLLEGKDNMVDSILSKFELVERNAGGAIRECCHRAAAQERQGGKGMDGGGGKEFLTAAEQAVSPNRYTKSAG